MLFLVCFTLIKCISTISQSKCPKTLHFLLPYLTYGKDSTSHNQNLIYHTYKKLTYQPLPGQNQSLTPKKLETKSLTRKNCKKLTSHIHKAVINCSSKIVKS